MEGSCCMKVVEDEISKLGLHCTSVELGRVEIEGAITDEHLRLIDSALRNTGLEILVDSKTLLIEKVKKVIYQLVYLSDDLPKQNLSDYISRQVNHDYPYLSFLFSKMMGVNIEKYIIAQKIERVKELLVYNKFSINEIAYKLNYSSVAHLSNQFKKVTGMTPTFYRQMGNSGIHKLK
jgi:YesN/AraC family two-component response regulator